RTGIVVLVAPDPVDAVDELHGALHVEAEDPRSDGIAVAAEKFAAQLPAAGAPQSVETTQVVPATIVNGREVRAAERPAGQRRVLEPRARAIIGRRSVGLLGARLEKLSGEGVSERAAGREQAAPELRAGLRQVEGDVRD